MLYHRAQGTWSGAVTGLLTHGLCGLLLLLQLPLQSGHLPLEVTCFYAAKRESLQRFPGAWLVAFMPSVPYGVVAAIAMWRAVGLRVRSGEVPGSLGPHLLCFLLAGCMSLYLSEPPCPPQRPRKTSDLPRLLRPHISRQCQWLHFLAYGFCQSQEARLEVPGEQTPQGVTFGDQQEPVDECPGSLAL